MTQASHFNPRVSIWTRCREWKQTHLRAAFEMSMLDEHDDEGTARIVDLADATKTEIEAAVIGSPIQTTDDAQAVLGLAIAILRDLDGERDGEERALALVRAAHRGMTSLHNANVRAAA